jgi:gluconokinase
VILIVAGVAGSGKSTVGALLASMLRWGFADGDTFHSEANVAKMRSGIPLTDADREPWLRAMGSWMDAQMAAGRSSVLACSLLKRAYRDALLSARPSALVVFLQVDKDVLAQRLSHRPGHFFTRQLLQSQLDTLEPPAPDERVRVVPVEDGAAKTAAKIAALLWPDGPDGKPDGQPDAAQ